jgi:PAS domain S-box-containing protein
MLTRRDAERAPRASDRNDRIVDSSPDCLAVLTLDARLCQMTPQGCRLLDVDDFSTIADTDWQAFWSGDDRLAVQQALAEARDGRAGRFQGYCATHKGVPKWWDVIISPIIGANGEAECLLAVARDISERKLAEQASLELNAALEAKVSQLEAINRELESFNCSVSHDLRAPLRAIDGFALMIEEDYSKRLDGEGRRYLSVIRENTKRMSALIDDLLAFSRLGRLPVVTREVNVETLVREVIEEVLVANEASRPHFEVGPLPTAQADRALLRQAWMNLVSNAVKYSSKAARPCIAVHGRRNADENLYSIRDNGVGFDMKYAKKMFGVFQRLHRADEFGGTGIGLAIVHRVVAKHGGRIWAEGGVDQGAVFSFTLPAGGPFGQVAAGNHEPSAELA